MSTLKETKKAALDTVKVKLSNSAGKLLIGCIETLRERGNSGDTDVVIRGILTAVENDLKSRLSLGKDQSQSEHTHNTFAWTLLSYETVVRIVTLTQEVDPDNLDKDFRDTLLNTLRAANPTTRETATAVKRDSALPPVTRGDSGTPQEGDGSGMGERETR